MGSREAKGLDSLCLAVGMMGLTWLSLGRRNKQSWLGIALT